VEKLDRIREELSDARSKVRAIYRKLRLDKDRGGGHHEEEGENEGEEGEKDRRAGPGRAIFG